MASALGGRKGPGFETKSIFCLELQYTLGRGMPWSWFTAQGDTANMNNHLHFRDSSLKNKETGHRREDQGSSFSIPTGSFYCPLLAEPSKAPTGKAKQRAFAVLAISVKQRALAQKTSCWRHRWGNPSQCCPDETAAAVGGRTTWTPSFLRHRISRFHASLARSLVQWSGA